MSKNVYSKIQERVNDSQDLGFRAIEGENKEMILEGYAAKFNVRSKLLYNQFYEILERKSFDDVLASKDLDAVMNFNHDNNLVMGRTTNGTLKLSTDDTGLFFRATLPDTSYARDVYELVKRGDIFQNSFAFMPDKKGYKRSTAEDGNDLYTVTKVAKLRDVSAVTFPAYPETSLAARADASTGETEEEPVVESEMIELDKEQLNEVLSLSIELQEKINALMSPKDSSTEEKPEETEEELPEEQMSDKNQTDIYKKRTQLLKIKYKIN